jgi:thioredoxin 1
MKTVLFFTADWCDPCHRIAPTIEEVFSNDAIKPYYSGVVKVNVDNEPERAAKYRANALPTFIIVNENGDEVARQVGVWSGLNVRGKIMEWLEVNS